MGDVIGYERVEFLLVVSVVAVRAYPCCICHLRELSEVVVSVGAGSRAIVIACPQQQTTFLFIGMGFDFGTCICYREHAPGCVCHRGGCVASSIRSGVNHPVCGVAASGVACYACVICLRERKTIHRHGFGSDVAGRQGVVALAFRSNMILYPLR